MELDNIDSYLKRTLKQGPMIGLYWLVLPENMLSEAQQGEQHTGHGPYYMAVEVTRTSVTFEFLVRSQSCLHCSCIAQANKRQRKFVLDYIDTMLEKEMITA